MDVIQDTTENRSGRSKGHKGVRKQLQDGRGASWQTNDIHLWSNASRVFTLLWDIVPWAPLFSRHCSLSNCSPLHYSSRPLSSSTSLEPLITTLQLFSAVSDLLSIDFFYVVFPAAAFVHINIYSVSHNFITSERQSRCKYYKFSFFFPFLDTIWRNGNPHFDDYILVKF